jgi:ferredoxin
MAHSVCVNESCIGVALCESLAPDVFVVGDTMRARVLVDPLPENLLELVEEAADSCPMAAIEIDGEQSD